MQNSRNTNIQIKQIIYLHSRHYFTSSNCIFMQLQGIVFIQLQGNGILVNCQGNIFIYNIYLFTKSIIIRGNYILTARNYIHFKELISSFREIYPRSMKHIHSEKLYPFKEICSFKEHIFVQVQGHMFIQGNYIY